MDLPKAIEAYREILVADPTHGETRAALERMFMGGTMQFEIADVLEPLYRQARSGRSCTRSTRCSWGALTAVEERQALLRRLAEIAEQKLVDQVAAFDWWAQAVKEDPSSELALDELLRLVRSTHQWDAYVATMSEAASSDRDVPTEPRVRRDVLLRLAASFEIDLGDLERAENALVQVLSENENDPTALASLDRIYETQGMYENLAAVLKQRIAITDDAAELVALQLRLGRVYAEALDDVDGAIASYLAVLEHESRSARRWRRWSACTSAASAGPSCTASTRSWSTSPRTTPPWPSATRAWPSWPPRPWASATRRSSCGGACSTCGATTPSRWRGWPICTRRRRVEGADRGPGAAGGRRPPEPTDKIPIYKRLGRIWGEKLWRERNALESWQKVLELDPQDVDALRAIADNYRSAGAWEELSQSLRRLIQVAQLGGSGIEPSRAQGSVLAARRARGRDPDAHAGRDRRLARGAGDRSARLPRAGGAGEAVHAGGALGRVRRHPRAARAGAGQPRPSRSTSSCRRPRCGPTRSATAARRPRSTSGSCRSTPAIMTASHELEQLYRQRKSWVKLIDLLLARTEFVPDAPARITCCSPRWPRSTSSSSTIARAPS